MQHHTQPGPAMPTESFPTDPLGCRRRPAPRSWSWPPATPSSCGSLRSPNGWATPRCGCSATTAPYPVPPSRSNRAPRGTVASLATRRSSETAGMRRRRPRPAPLPRAAFAGFRFPCDVIVLAVHWYLRFGLSYRDVEELLAERGVEVDHVTVYRWVQRFTPPTRRRCPALPTRRRRPLAGGRDRCEGRREMAVGVPGG